MSNNLHLADGGARFAHLFLRIGLAFAFLYPPIAAIGDPTSWISYFPGFVRGLPIDELFLLHSFGLIEIGIALWILSGRNVRIPATLATIILLAIVIFDYRDFGVLFRDLSIAAMALALVVWPTPNGTVDKNE